MSRVRYWNVRPASGISPFDHYKTLMKIVSDLKQSSYDFIEGVYVGLDMSTIFECMIDFYPATEHEFENLHGEIGPIKIWIDKDLHEDVLVHSYEKGPFLIKVQGLPEKK